MALVLDASMTLAWQFTRTDPAEAEVARNALVEVDVEQATVPATWFSEVTSGRIARRASGSNSATAERLLPDGAMEGKHRYR
jgi:hypothetical protein